MDLALASCFLFLLLPFVLVIGLLIKLDSKGPALFRQRRVGQGLRPFTIYKFRTMLDEEVGQCRVATSTDPRITRIGRLLRPMHIDEIPQLLNVLKGDMSLVGPLRPPDPDHVRMFRHDYEKILQIRPGLTDPASLQIPDEPERLRRADDPEMEYNTRLLPEKIRIGREYLVRSSFTGDLVLIGQTILYLCRQVSRVWF